jgi:signal transduction histidine kinase
LLMSRPLNTKLEEHSLVEILDYVLEVLGEEIRRKNIKVLKRWGDNLATVTCDRFQLTQAFLNILDNALAAMAPGGEMVLEVKRVEGSGTADRGKTVPRLKFKEAEGGGSFLEILIRDTGKGMPPEVLKKIFAPYYTTKEKGVGLGLAITQKIVQSHGGSVEVTSSENQGTTVAILLPL